MNTDDLMASGSGTKHVTVFKLLQPAKALELMVATDSPIVTLAKAAQPLKAFMPILLT
jgi:hypothetical protein